MRLLLLLLTLGAWLVPAYAEPALTIYNQNFAVVRETVPLTLQAGVSTVHFAGITAQLEPDSVVLRDPAGQANFRILEQSYRNDPVSQGLLLSFNEGKTIRFQVEESNGPDRMISGKIVRSGYTPGGQQTEPIIEVNGELQFALPGQPLFPALADDNILKPTLTWQIQSESAAQLNAELGYVTQGLSWAASYNLVLPEKGEVLDLAGWITLNNQSGKAFTNAELKFMAGDVQKLAGDREAQHLKMREYESVAAAPRADNAVSEKKFDDFHLYTLGRKATLRDKETKQVEFIRGSGVKAQRIYIFEPTAGIGIYDEPSVMQNRSTGANVQSKVLSKLEFKNSADNQLGLPFPAGRMRLYRKDGEQLQFVGEDEIDHTPKDETVKLTTGFAFDLVGERKQTSFELDTQKRKVDEIYEIELRNRQDQPVEICAIEHLYRGAYWKILESSQAYTKKDSRTVEFRVPLAPNETRKVTYRVQYTW